jgi:hypothetical protein
VTWLRTDDGFPEHPKSDALAEHFGDDWQTLNLAFATWHHMGCDCAARRTDGEFSAPRAYRVIRAPREVIDRAIAGLVEVGLIERRGDRFVFHDWSEYQPTRAQLEEEKAAKTARQQRWRAGKSPRDSHGVDGAVDASTSRLVDGAVDSAPSRPVPTRPDPSEQRQGDRGSAEGAAPSPTPRTSMGGTPSGGAPSGSSAVPKVSDPIQSPSKSRRTKPAPVEDTLPLPGTVARQVYDVIVADRWLRPITGNPGDFSTRITAPNRYPGVDVLFQTREAADWLDRNAGAGKVDGRAFLAGWMRRTSEAIARAPQPAAAPIQTSAQATSEATPRPKYKYGPPVIVGPARPASGARRIA